MGFESDSRGRLTVHKEVVEVTPALHGGVEEASYVRPVLRQVLHFPLVVLAQLRVDHVPVLTVPHKQRNGPVKLWLVSGVIMAS